MEIHTTQNPAKTLGEKLTEIINNHSGDTLCLLAGGSSLDVVEFIQPTYKPECRTIFVMGDERVSGEPSVNNYLQLEARYPDFRILKHTINTTASNRERPTEFAKRIAVEIEKNISQSKNLKIISLLGVGGDGHIAGIFPMDRADFNDTYPHDQMYVPVTLEGLERNFRATFTPNWILNNVTELFVYAQGESKLDILYMLTSENKSNHERPAEIIKQHMSAHIYTDQTMHA